MQPISFVYRQAYRRVVVALFFMLAAGLIEPAVWAQQQGAPLPNAPAPDAQGAALPYPPPPAPSYPPQELDRLVSPIALYPDPLLGQTLAAATFAPEIPDAAHWADQHHYLSAASLPAAIDGDRLPWQPSVQALLPFPSVLDMMASAMPWTQELGAAFLSQPQQVMDAVQRMRQQAFNYGYLRSNAQVVVRSGPFIEIEPVDPAFIVVPYYSPAVVFAAPRRGFVVTSAISFGFGVRLGAAFSPWGWGTTRFAWSNHVLMLNNAPWARTWGNRAVYVHPYTVLRAAGPRVEPHRLIERNPREREAERAGRGREREEEHR